MRHRQIEGVEFARLEPRSGMGDGPGPKRQHLARDLGSTMSMSTPSPREPGETDLVATFATAMLEAGRVLAEMSGRPIRISAPSVRHCPPDEVVAMVGGPQKIVVGVYLGVFGALSGHALLVLEPNCAHRLAGLLLESLDGARIGGPLDTGALAEIEASTLGEIGNVTVSAFLNTLALGSPAPLQPTPPQVVVEMAGAIVDAVVVDLLVDRDRVLAAHTVFHDGDEEVQALLLILLQPSELQDLLAAPDPPGPAQP